MGQVGGIPSSDPVGGRTAEGRMGVVDLDEGGKAAPDVERDNVAEEHIRGAWVVVDALVLHLPR